MVFLKEGFGVIIDGFQNKSMNPHIGRTVTMPLADLHDTFPSRPRAGGRNPQEAGETHSSKASNFLYSSPSCSRLPLQLRQSRRRPETRRQFTGARSPAPSVLTVGCRRAKQAGPRLTKRLIFRDGVNKDNYDTLITALIPAEAAVPVNGPCPPQLYTGGLPGPLGAGYDPVLPSSGGDSDSISPLKKKEEGKKKRKREEKVATAQLPSVFTAAPHQTFIKCHLYSV